MTYPLLTLDESLTSHSALFIEGLVLAANMATQPLAPHTWLPSVFDQQAEVVSAPLEGQINQQYHCLKCNDYSLLDLVDEAQIEVQLSEVAQGFMTLWPMIEPQWSQASVSDGTLRMLQALLTTFMLAIDPLQTEQQMQAAGIVTPPTLAQMYPQLDLMISDVAQAADELMLGAKAQNINPYKNIGRNDPCPCGSGSKFKQCCGA